MMLSMKHIPWKETVWAAAFVVLVVAIYAGAYLAMVERDVAVISRPFLSASGSPPSPTPGGVVPRYRVGSDVLAWLFAPAHGLDRRLRPFYWSWEGFIGTGR